MSSFDVRIVTLAEFVAVDEAGAQPLLGDADAILIPAGGLVPVYGDGGAGKTTLMLDLAFHLAAGDDWLGIPVRQESRLLIIENEGPRPLFRKKLSRKLDSWQGTPFDDRISVLEEPWARLSFTEDNDCAALTQVIREREIDVVMIGPVTAAGMLAAGTIQEVRAFAEAVASVGVRAGRQVTFILIHHENKGGQVSGAWEGVGDTLFHVLGAGHGKTRLFIQKARWSSAHHATTMHLRWAEGEGFDLEEKPEVTPEQLAEMIVGAVAERPGTGWTRVEEATPGVKSQTRRGVRDDLLRRGLLVNIGNDADKRDKLLNHVPERHRARLHLPDDPTIAHLRPDPDADGTQSASAWAAGECRSPVKHLRPASPSNRDADVGTQRPPPSMPGPGVPA